MIHVTDSIFKYPITITAQKFGDDWGLSITGGETPHIGAVSLAYQENGAFKVESIVCDRHKDHIVGEHLALEVAQATSSAVSVESGIHYDKLSQNQIEQIINLTERLTSEMVRKIKEQRI